MNSAEMMAHIEELEEDIDDVEENFEPFLSDALSATTKKLPLLDKAKLYVLLVYGIESLLFSYLRLNGVAAKEHHVFRELARVRQYFDKIKEVETGPPAKRENMSLNKDAAGRIVKHALSGNAKLDLELRERKAREALLAKRKLKELEQKIRDATTASSSPQTQPEQNNRYLSEGEIDENDEDPDANLPIPSSSVQDQLSEEGEVPEDDEEQEVEGGKSQSRKRRKSGGRKSTLPPKKKQKQKQKHNTPSQPG